MKILGIDPGSRCTGYGLVEVRGSTVRYILAGAIAPLATLPLALRLDSIFQNLCEIIARSQPAAVAIEGLFTHKNARSALILGQARGVALLAASRANVAIHEYPPAQVKLAVGAGGRASKEGVTLMVRRILCGVPETLRADAYDGLAIALCHANRVKLALPAKRGGAWKSNVRLRSARILYQ